MARKHLTQRRDDEMAAAARTAARHEKHETMLEAHDKHCGPLRVDGRRVGRVSEFRKRVPRTRAFKVT